jgi:hypothetical protein
MRLGEMLAVRWKDVDLERQVLRVTATLSYAVGEFTFPAPKTYRARRSVDLPAFVVMFLKRHRKAQAAQQMRVRDVWEDYGTVLTDEIGPAAGAVVGLVGLPSARQRARATKNTVPRFTARARHSIVIRRRPPEGGQRTARAQQHRVHDGHLLGRDPVTRTGGRRCRRPTVRRGRGKVMQNVKSLIEAKVPEPHVSWVDGKVRIELTWLDAQGVMQDYGKGNGPALAAVMQGMYDLHDEIK